MKKFYIPTSSLNFNNILSSESISPKAFYQVRSFGYGRWTNIPENPYNNSIVLYDELRTFSRPVSDIEDHPLLIEIAIDEAVESSLVKIDEHIFLSDHTIYIDPFSTKLYFFSDRDKTIALSLSDSSIETKFVSLYQKKIEVIALTGSSYPTIDSTSEMQALNAEEIEKDKRINRMRGLLYGYYIGALLSAEKGDVYKLNTAREIRDIFAAILASYDHQATAQQRERLKALYATIQPEVPFFSKLRALIPEKGLFESIVSLVRGEYGYIRGEINVDSIVSKLLASQASSDEKNPVIEDINSLIRQTEKEIQFKARPVSVVDDQIVVVNGALTNISILDQQDKILYMAWINDVLSKDEYSGKTSTFKDVLSDDVTRKAKAVCEGEWKGSYPEVILNALRRHVRGEEFPHNWGDDIFSSISALIIRGDDWQQLLQFMQSKGMTDYRVAFSMYGTINGLANLPRDFTDVLFSRERLYIAEVYKEFYGQLFSREIVVPAKNDKGTEIPITIPSLEEDMPDFDNQHICSDGKPELKDENLSDSSLDGFDRFMSDLIAKCSCAKKDELLYKELFARYGGLTPEFVDAVKTDSSFNKGKGIQQGVCAFLNKLVKPAKSGKNKQQKVEAVRPASLFADSYSSTGSFLSDFDFLVNCSKFNALMSSVNRKWEDDLRWFIDAHNPSNKDYHYYQDKPLDNVTLINQFLKFKQGKYRITESFLREHYAK